MPTINALSAQLIRRASDDLVRLVNLTPPEKQVWSPLEEGRTVLDQIVEVAATNDIGARTLEERGRITLEPGEWDRHKAVCIDMSAALECMAKSTQRLIAAVEAFPADAWDSTMVMPFGDGDVRSFAEVAMMHYWHMTYHYAQVSYIQTLYGDRVSW
jgi:uncharacterized damage-inducible protein DinB